MFNFFKNNEKPIEQYIIAVLKKNKHNVELARAEIYARYPFFKKTALTSVIQQVLSKQINNEKISGFWKKIGNEWQLISKDIKSESLPWSGPDLPAGEEQSSTGPNRGTFTVPQGAPRNRQVPEPKMRHEPINEEVTKAETDEDRISALQSMYDELFERFKYSIGEDDVNKLNKMILEELMELGYGSKIVRIKLKEKI